MPDLRTVTSARCFRVAAAVLTVAIAAGACSTSSSSGSSSTTPASDAGPPGDIPDTQAFVPFADPAGQFSIKVPEGWARTTNGPQTTFTNQYNTVTVAAVPGATVSPQSIRATVVPELQRTEPRFALVRVADLNRPDGPAVVTTYTSESSPNSVTGKRIALDAQRYDISRAGRVATITVSAPRGSDNVDAWRTISSSFAWTG